MKESTILILFGIGLFVAGCDSEAFQESRHKWDVLGVLGDSPSEKREKECDRLARDNMRGLMNGHYTPQEAAASMARNGC